jgi:hypothetical protein
MSFDLRIDTTEGNDVVFSGGRAETVHDAEARAQRIGIALRHIRGEWFLDANAGTDYFGRILGKSTDLSRRAEIRRRILEIPGVREIRAITLHVDPRTRALSGDVEVLDQTGVQLDVPIGGV